MSITVLLLQPPPCYQAVVEYVISCTTSAVGPRRRETVVRDPLDQDREQGFEHSFARGRTRVEGPESAVPFNVREFCWGVPLGKSPNWASVPPMKG